MGTLSPMMQQYLKIHEEVPDAFLLYRLGDFYEMFFDDAIKGSKILDLVLTGRDCGLEERAPMCGVPYHSVDSYIAKLVDKGYKVAICEQITDPKESKGLVERSITRIVTSGTVTDINSLCDDKNNYIMCIYYNKINFGVSYCDVTTGEMTSVLIEGESAEERFLNILSSVMPSEILVNSVLFQSNELKTKGEYIAQHTFTLMAASNFNYEKCETLLLDQLNAYSLNAIGLESVDECVKSCGVLVSYLKDTQKNLLKHINKINIKNDKNSMHIDFSTRRNLELTETLRNNSKKGSLLWVLDKAVTNIGSRTLRKWINEPLINQDEIIKREDVISEFCANIMLMEDIRCYMEQTSDIQRICSKLSYRTINGRDFLSLKETLFQIPKLNVVLNNASSAYLNEINKCLDPISEIYDLIESAIDEECTVNIKDGNTFKAGFDSRIDDARNFKMNAKKILADLETNEREKTGIKNLRIKYNKVFGYYFEVSKGNINNVPDYFIRKQTLVNAERYYTEELKDIEIKLLDAQSELEKIETFLFDEIIDKTLANLVKLQKTAEYLGILDALCSMAYISIKNKYVRPGINSNGTIEIIDARHPVVELLIDKNQFIPNDIKLDTKSNRMNIITGPNMSGKSTYIRQTALCSILFQIGCFIPCTSANMCIVDRVFTRVGASDDLANGQSTFMVEMSEVSNILRHASANSLVILDEVGRGTSTLDGLSIAWAVVEYLHDAKIVGCKTLFATHYHELTELEKNEGVTNLHIEIEERENSVVFLHKILEGAANKSYGIEVAKLAGLPDYVISRSEEILRDLENKEVAKRALRHQKINSKKKNDLPTFNLLNYREINILSELKALPLNDMTPIEVMNYISKIQKELN